MKIIIVSGLSGAGKSIALTSLEDIGAYCVDNLPLALIPAFAQILPKLENLHECVVIGLDARAIVPSDMPQLLSSLSALPAEILFLEASDNVLIQRFSETRRRHPLHNLALSEAIQHERILLAPLARQADIRIDTSKLSVHELRECIKSRIQLRRKQNLAILFESFGFKYGLPCDADFVFDVRCLPNPYWDSRLRGFTGCDAVVAEFLHQQPKVQQMLQDIIEFLDKWIEQFTVDSRSYLTIAVGCTGGQHRSVYMVEQLQLYFIRKPYTVLIRHRELR
jgi:RNase adapter protein RapZ